MEEEVATSQQSRLEAKGQSESKSEKPKRSHKKGKPHGKAGRSERPVGPSRLPGKEGVSRQVLYLVGASVATVIGLFLISLTVGRTSATTDGSPTESGAPSAASGSVVGGVLPLPESVQSAAQDLLAQIGQAETTDQQMNLRRQLVELYAGAGRYDLSGAAQEEVAAEEATAESWAVAGNFHFDWMQSLPDGIEKGNAARTAIAAYTRSLEINPDDNNVRTDRAVAYLNSPESPMTAIEEINAVLESEPDHPQANFNKAVMMTMIGRSEQAVELYRRVIELTDPGSQMHEEARLRIEQMQGASTGS